MKNSDEDVLVTEILATCIVGLNEDINMVDENFL